MSSLIEKNLTSCKVEVQHTIQEPWSKNEKQNEYNNDENRNSNIQNPDSLRRFCYIKI